ncbi:aldehyde dehydrogenase [Evansella sp. AB-rgal1]|uniref:aldehyde dehydrogenase n=1 Tax=Evansella sp. AB-rgal1 TaxID=3242696 RepID=UPI00359CED8F
MKEAIHDLVEKQRTFFYKGDTRDITYRQKQLVRLREAIKSREEVILSALKKDLNKSEQEAFITEIGFIYNEIKDVLKNVDYWAAPRRQKTPITHLGSKSYIYQEPYGVALIIAPWNYPFHLAIAPAIGAIAAGNTVIIKPSELTPHTSTVIRELITDTFQEEYVAVVEGDAEVAKELISDKVNYIFFTGSVQVGKKVMEAAAKNLTPVTLELGGKSPAIVMSDANLKLAAKRIVWGKFTNAGQTCIAPDYILVQEKVRRKLLKLLVHYIKKLHGEDVRFNRDYPKIVTEKHVDRLAALIDDETKVYHGGEYDRVDRYFEPTILANVTEDDPIMGEEIFGPILPVLSFTNDYEAIEFVRRRPSPLALYLFTEDKGNEKYFFESLQFGGGCLNDTIMHIGTPYLPFGGIGESGMGAYHGKYSFDTFSHEKSIVRQTTKFDIPLRYSKSKRTLKTIRKIWE